MSADNKWAIVISMPAEFGEGRVETYYQLINIPDWKTVNNEIEEMVGLITCREANYFLKPIPDGQLMLKYRANDDEY